MSVYYTGGGGGLFGSLLGALGMGSSFVPGLQGLQKIAPYLMGAGALANGNVGGAIGSVAAPMAGDMIDRTKTANARNASNQESLFGALTSAMQNPQAETMGDDPTGALLNAHRGSFPDWNTDPVSGQRNPYKHSREWRQ